MREYNVDIKKMTDPKSVGPKLQTIFPEVCNSYNVRFASLHQAFEKGIENDDVFPQNSNAPDGRVSYLYNALRDFGTPLKTEDQLVRILKSGESILRKGPPSPKHRDIVEMYYFARAAIDKAMDVRMSPPVVGKYEPIRVEDIGKRAPGVDISVSPRTLFNAVADKFNQEYPQAPMRHVGDLFEICRLGRDPETTKQYPEILLPYVHLCQMMNRTLKDMGVSRYLIY